MHIDALIESILFYKAEPVSFSALAQILSISEEEVVAALSVLESRLEDRGITLMQKDGSALLVTTLDASEIIETLSKEDYDKDLSKAALETLSIVLYHGPVSRAEIDYIRGVQSQFIIRTLLVRGLIEKKVDPNNGRNILYGPTFELLGHLGIKSVEELPERVNIEDAIENFSTEHVSHEIFTTGNE